MVQHFPHVCLFKYKVFDICTSLLELSHKTIDKHSPYSSQYALKANILVIKSPTSTPISGGSLNPRSHLSDSGSVNQPSSIKSDSKRAQACLLEKLRAEMLNILGVCEDIFYKGDLRHAEMTLYKGNLVSQCLLVK